jgi:ATP-dependent protease Clp ATPase subunit
MMAMPLGPLMSVLFSITFMAMLMKFNPTLTLFVSVLSGVTALTIILYKGRYFPRWIMDVLDRLTNKASLEAAYGARQRKLVTIDAAVLADRLKSRVIGQDAAIESIAVQLRRRLAAQRSDKPVAVFCLAGPPGVGKTHLAKVLADEL